MPLPGAKGAAWEIFYDLKIYEMKEFEIWLAWFRRAMEKRFEQLDQLLYILKKKKK
jgi:hypothetical protein